MNLVSLEFFLHKWVAPIRVKLTFSPKVQFIAILIKLIQSRLFLILFEAVIEIELNEVFHHLLLFMIILP